MLDERHGFLAMLFILLATRFRRGATPMTLIQLPRYAWVALLIGIAASCASAQQAKTATGDAQLSPDEKQIRQGVIAFVEQYNAHKADELATLFWPDARMVLRDGTEVNGRDAIKQSFEEAFRENPKSAISVVVDSIRLLTPDVAVEEGATTMFPDGETLTSQDRYATVLTT